MKRCFALVLLGLCVVLFFPRSAEAEEKPGWAITELTFAPTSPRVGDPVVFTVMLSPSTSVTSPLTVSATLELHAFAKEQNNRDVTPNCVDPISIDLTKQTPITHTFACRVIFPIEGDYRVSTTLTLPLTVTESPVNNLTQQSFVVSPYATALPDQVARLFASFGLFAAIMVVMALATEVIISTSRNQTKGSPGASWTMGRMPNNCSMRWARSKERRLRVSQRM